MFGFLKPVGKEATDPLVNAATAHAYWQTLPKADPIAAQEALCKALAEPIARGSANIDRLQALLLLDQRARSLVDALLVGDAARNPHAPAPEIQSWQAAFDLCRTFGKAYGQLLRLMRDREFEDHRVYESLLLLRLFLHRQLELLLRPFSDDRAPAFSWKEMHEAYRFAQARELLSQDMPIKRNHSRTAETSLEREYVHVLMQDLMNGGHFAPREASWISQRLPIWCRTSALKPDRGRNGVHRFVVDPHGDAGLVRSDGESESTSLSLDMAPLLDSIDREVALLRDPAARVSRGSLRRERQVKVLQKVRVLLAAEPPPVTRREERRPTAATVAVAVGLPQILRSIRNNPDDPPAAPSQNAGSGSSTITGFGDASEDSQGMNPMTQPPAGALPLASLTMVDESDTGCRLQGAALATNPAIPGAMIAFRTADGASPWTLAVMRRVKKRLAGRRVEIGAEYLGKDPRWVVIVVSDGEARSGKPAAELQRFAGLYLPESAKLPFKTLVLPACGLSPGDCVSVRSRASVHTVRLKEFLEEQADFIWSPFEIIDRWLKEEPGASDALSEGCRSAI
jgi:hypothetical protein